MKLFLVSGDLSKTYYMEDEQPTQLVTRIVMAADEEEAKDKFINHFDKQSEEYIVSYYVTSVVAYEAIQ